LYEAGQVAELTLAVKAKLHPTLMLARVQKPPSEQWGPRWRG